MMSEPSGKKYKIVLVEDDRNIALLFRHNLTKAGFICEVARNGREGMDKVRSVYPDLIISDVMMPEVDGFEFRKLLLEDISLKSIPFVFLTAKGEDDDVLQGYDLNIEDYIIKSSSMKIVVAKISAILNSMEKERKRIVDEVHKAADNMGAAVVPNDFPSFNGYDIKHWHVPYQNVPGGDFIDYFKLDDDHMVIILGDVMGKKWGAWYFAVAYAGYVRSAVRFVLQSSSNNSPSEILHKVNESVYSDERISEIFITLSVVVIDKQNNSIRYCGAGDLPLIHKSGEVRSVKSNGLLLGVNTEGNYQDCEVKLASGDYVFLITDGIIESHTSEGKDIGEKTLFEIIRDISPGEDGIEKIKNNIGKITSDTYQDDISIIGIKAE